ncbi:hypothetical protein BDV95DRAFT_597815 [Massariosphaeria phaeospora]|uniref:Uncharacterized protein n=1 Tax=Massariosphaeria phaeospora TaxID=100035 RepID=A0A7C8M3E2_9PLEO|nr:hypothetical protein BDV95DRAFT_597815 [Massariosphaeria phaeospora]
MDTPSHPTAQPFPLMALPKELRLLVYEHLPRTIVHLTIPIHREENAPCNLLPGSTPARQFTLIMRSTNVTILRVSKVIYEEALTIVQNTIKHFILAKAPKVASCWYEAQGWAVETIMGYVVIEYLQLKQEMGQLKQDTGRTIADPDACRIASNNQSRKPER